MQCCEHKYTAHMNTVTHVAVTSVAVTRVAITRVAVTSVAVTRVMSFLPFYSNDQVEWSTKRNTGRQLIFTRLLIKTLS